MGEVARLSELDGHFCNGRSVVVDAVFGTGLTRTANVVGGIWNIAKKAGCRLVAVDILSGVCADSGRYISGNADAFFLPPVDLTVTFEAAKVGHFLSDGPELCRCVRTVPLGISSGKASLEEEIATLARPFLAALPKIAGHKYAHGHALILSGPPGRTGAARLAARGALRIGAGLVTIGAAPEAIPEHAARLDAIMLRPFAEAAALADALRDRRITALCIGPGLGLDDAARVLVAAALGCTPRPAVLDADALTILAQDPDLFAALHDKCVLTPHAGEFARLFPDIAEKLAAPATKGPAYSKVDATREAAKRAGCVVLYKGPDTVIADPSGRCSINSAHYDRAAPWLATAGSGDVLAGFIAGLLARGFAPMQAAETGAWLHVECARSFGPGLIAEDLPEELPKVFRALGL
jgi:hydroxyethylthiazole kinase-like uncharacterized protein yjeF